VRERSFELDILWIFYSPSPALQERVLSGAKRVRVLLLATVRAHRSF